MIQDARIWDEKWHNIVWKWFKLCYCYRLVISTLLLIVFKELHVLLCFIPNFMYSTSSVTCLSLEMSCCHVVFLYIFGCFRANCFGCLSVLFNVVLGALVAPIMWLSIALLNGTFYECAVSGLEQQALVNWFCKNRTSVCKDELAKVPCQTSNMPATDIKELLLILHAQSQVLLLLLLEHEEGTLRGTELKREAILVKCPHNSLCAWFRYVSAIIITWIKPTPAHFKYTLLWIRNYSWICSKESWFV